MSHSCIPLGTALLATLLITTPAIAITKCKAKIDGKTGLVVVSGSGLAGPPTWGDAIGDEIHGFFNEATCYDIVDGKLKGCYVADPQTAAATIPPPRCTVYVSDGNNTCHSLIHTASKLGVHIRVCSPEGYEPNSRVVNEAMRQGQETGCEVQILNDPEQGAEGADAIYTDVWASMGHEDEIAERNGIFAPYQVTEALMARAKPDALFMHCLPAHRGWEVTQEVMDGPRSIVYDIAENRLHVQKALLAMLLH